MNCECNLLQVADRPYTATVCCCRGENYCNTKWTTSTSSNYGRRVYRNDKRNAATRVIVGLLLITILSVIHLLL